MLRFSQRIRPQLPEITTIEQAIAAWQVIFGERRHPDVNLVLIPDLRLVYTRWSDERSLQRGLPSFQDVIWELEGDTSALELEAEDRKKAALFSYEEFIVMMNEDVYLVAEDALEEGDRTVYEKIMRIFEERPAPEV